MALHTSPREAVEELTALTQVVEDIRSKWGVHTNILIMGDLNADCDYVPKKAWPGIPIRRDSQFWWPIADDVDTTVNTNTNCAYDRCVHTGVASRQSIALFLCFVCVLMCILLVCFRCVCFCFCIYMLRLVSLPGCKCVFLCAGSLPPPPPPPPVCLLLYWQLASLPLSTLGHVV